MGENNKLATSDGLSVLTALFIIFLVLKLTGYITWSWWLVTAPLWLVPALFFAIIIIALCFTLCLGLVGCVLYGIYELFNLMFNK